MRIRVRHVVLGIVVVAGLYGPRMAWAQSANTGTIAGVVKDATGAVLPGVTVEAASPALIEKVRTVVTDGQGQYKIVDLRPGVYAVTFSLPGFGGVKREGLELQSGFTANVNVELRVGSLEETVTVTGASPVVDIQNVRTQTVFKQEVLDSLPNAKTFAAFATVTLGTTVSAQSIGDVGGNTAETNPAVAIHGGRTDSRSTQDGMKADGLDGAAGATHVAANLIAFQETSVETSGMSAESESGGVQFNRVPKDGGNRFSLYANTNYAGSRLQTENLSDELRARGLRAGPKIKKIWDYGLGVGGPIKKDRVWFYVADRWWGAQNLAPGNYFTATPHSLSYTPDLSKPAFTNTYLLDPASLRLTWQITPRSKLAIFHTYQENCYCYWSADSVPQSPEASPMLHWYADLAQISWTYPATNRLLFESGATRYGSLQRNQAPDGVLPTDIPITELSSGYQYNARALDWLGRTQYGTNNEIQFNQRLAVSYVTGSHAFKTGMTLMEAIQTIYANYAEPLPLSYQFLNGAPVQLTEWASPFSVVSWVWPSLGLFAQDQWSIKQLTLNVGARFDFFRGHNPAWATPPGAFAPARTFPRQENAPDWKDVEPRLGAAYDVFGNGKTAVKAFFGRYTVLETTVLTRNVSPALALVTSATRTWADANGNLVPDCDFSGFAASGECGAISNNRFGTVNQTQRYADDVLHGFGVRPYTWQTSAGVQQELRPGVAMNVNYFRTSYGNFGVTSRGSITVVDNLAVTPADYDPYCITAPVDARLPGGGGNQLCGLYDIRPAKFGQVDNLITQASNYGPQTEVFNGVDMGVNARFGRGALIAGGVSVGRTVTDTCAIVDSPQKGRPGFCRVTPPWSAQTQLKVSAVYPLPWDVQTSATLQNLPGIPISATYVATNAQIAPSLGRDLGAGARGTATVDLIQPQTMFEKRLTQLDLRFSKKVRLGRARITGLFDIYNATNSNTVVRIRTAYSATWLQPIQVLTPRFFKFGAQMDF